MSLTNLPGRAGRRRKEASFSLLETVVALGLMVTVIVEVAQIQGNAIFFAGFSRYMTQASWLARAKMSQVEYWSRAKPWTNLDIDTEGDFKDLEIADDPGFRWKITVQDWKFDLIEVLSGQSGAGKEAREEREQEAPDPDDPIGSALGGGGDLLQSALKEVFGNESLLKIAYVEVSWPDGARRNQTSLTYLLTNQAKLDETLANLPVSGGSGPGGTGQGQGQGQPGQTPAPGGTNAGVPGPAGTSPGSGNPTQ